MNTLQSYFDNEKKKKKVWKTQESSWSSMSDT